MPRSRTTRSGQCSRTKQNHVFKELRDTQARKALVSYHDCKSATMGDFELRSDAINVEDVMEQIRARIRDKRGVDYTEQQIRELAAVKLETFLDSRSVRSDLLKEFRAARPSQLFVPFGPDPLFTARRPIIARLRNLLRPVLRLFFNPDPIAEAFARVNLLAELHVAERDQYFELLHNLVLELTRTTIEVRNLTMRVESLSSRLDFDERRARALEGAVVYREVPEIAAPAAENSAPEGPGQRSHRIASRRWRRGRRPAAAVMGASAQPGAQDTAASASGEKEKQIPAIDAPGSQNPAVSDPSDEI